MPTPDASQFTQLKKYNAVQARMSEGQPQSRTLTHLHQPIPSVTHPLNFLASFTNKYTSTPVVVPINRVTGVQYKPKVPGGNVNGQTGGSGGIILVPTILEYNAQQGPSVVWGATTFTRQTGFSYSATITSIPSVAVPNASSLTSVTIPSSVTSIGTGAFEGASSLTSITIPSSVTSIGIGAFENAGLTSVILPTNLTSISDYMFAGCAQLSSITIPSSVTTIGQGAFSDSGLSSVTIPNSVTSIGESAFSNCVQMTSVTLSTNLTNIGENAFTNSGLTSITIPNSVTTIGTDAFSLSQLTSVTIANGQLGKTSPVSNPPGVSFFGKTVATVLP